ncbi:MAG: hypothetical protein KGM49_00705 [Sphingomonadales bacterium]|nr:hypothetical protein [Sphingomonadales bacterium]
MKTIYTACLARLGLTQSGAAALHGVRLDTVKSWSSGRNRVPQGAWDDLRVLELAIMDGSEELRERWEAAGSPPVELDDSEADGVALMAAADFVLSSEGPVSVGQSAATLLARQARRPN